MEEIKIDVANIKLAQIRYFEETRGATEIPPKQGFVFLTNINGSYINIFNPLEKVNVYERVPYSNITSNGEDFGNKLVLSNGKVEDGICYVLEPFSMRKKLRKEEVTYKDLTEFILNSDLFFIDRLNIIENSKLSFKDYFKITKIIKKDIKDREELELYFEQFNGFQYKK